ncbi:MAG TPA: hypothetical protein VIO61_01750 [Anaerolineaceae bacterium]
MKNWIYLLMLLFLAGCSTAGTPTRSAQPAFKGIELYSWKPEGKDWQFSLLPGTNRLKSTEEVTASQATISGVTALKKHLASLAVGEQVFWHNLANEPVPEAIVQEIVQTCEQYQITLVR